MEKHLKSVELLTGVVAFIVTTMLTCLCFVGQYLCSCTYPAAGDAPRFPPSELPQHQLGESL